MRAVKSRPVFSKVLIANRGEIALRMIRACEELGIATVAVYSELDRDAPHVRRADEAFLLGPGPANESYLVIEKLIEVAAALRAPRPSIPGYGFLAENAAFAAALAENGITFIGPPRSAIEAMGSKTRARELMAEAGVPIVPGTTEPVATVEEATEADRRHDRLPGGRQGGRRRGRQGLSRGRLRGRARGGLRGLLAGGREVLLRPDRVPGALPA